MTAADPSDDQARGALARPNTVGRVLARGPMPRRLEELREALAIGEQLLAADVKNVQVRYSLAISRRGLGEVYGTLALQPDAPLAVRDRHWREARAWFQQSLDDLSDMKARGQLEPPETDAVDEIPRQIARGDRALEQMKR